MVDLQSHSVLSDKNHFTLKKGFKKKEKTHYETSHTFHIQYELLFIRKSIMRPSTRIGSYKA